MFYLFSSLHHIRLLRLLKQLLIRLLFFKLWGHRAPAETIWGNISETGGVVSRKMMKEKMKTNQKYDRLHQKKCLYQTPSYHSFYCASPRFWTHILLPPVITLSYTTCACNWQELWEGFTQGKHEGLSVFWCFDAEFYFFKISIQIFLFLSTDSSNAATIDQRRAIVISRQLQLYWLLSKEV